MQIKNDVLLADISWFRVGGPVDYFVEVATKADLLEVFEFLHNQEIPYLFVGSGSNIVFSCDGFRGIVIRPKNIHVEHLGKGRFQVGAGVQNAAFYQFARDHGYDFSGFYTVPGSIGGAIVGNSGIPGFEMKDYLESAEIFDIEQKTFRVEPHNFFRFSYRNTIFHEQPELRQKIIIWSANLRLKPCLKAEIERKAEEILQMRKQKQPWGKTGGSFFKNPAAGAAGYFLEQIGAKKMRVGGAFFSEKHANFLMSDGTATQHDIIQLAHNASQRVYEKFGVKLESEVLVLDEWGREIRFLEEVAPQE